MTSAVLIGASAGGIDPLIRLVEDLPEDLRAPVFVVVHVPPDADSRLPEILARRSRLLVGHAVDGEPIENGRIYVAPPDHHLLVEGRSVRLVRGPRQNRHRPSIDALLRSAARRASDNTVAVILSGAAGDAVSGCVVIDRRGGTVLVQDPGEALFPGMPAKVLEAVPDARRVRISDMAAAVTAAIDVLAGAMVRPVPTRVGQEMDTMDELSTAPVADTGLPAYSCPDCGGVLEEVEDADLLRFRCRVGHSFYGDELAAAQWGELENALWAAVRGMEETAELAGRLARMADERGAAPTAARHRQRADDVLTQAQVIRDFLLSPETDGEEDLRVGPPRPSEMAAAGE